MGQEGEGERSSMIDMVGREVEKLSKGEVELCELKISISTWLLQLMKPVRTTSHKNG